MNNNNAPVRRVAEGAPLITEDVRYITGSNPVGSTLLLLE